MSQGPRRQQAISSRMRTEEVAQKALDELRPLLEHVAQLPFRRVVVQRAENACKRLTTELEVTRLLRSMKASTDPVSIEKELLRAKDLGLPIVGDLKALELRAERLRQQLGLVKELQGALASTNDTDLVIVLEEVDNAGLKSRPEEWLAELPGAALTKEAVKRVEDSRKARSVQKRTSQQLLQPIREVAGAAADSLILRATITELPGGVLHAVTKSTEEIRLMFRRDRWVVFQSTAGHLPIGCTSLPSWPDDIPSLTGTDQELPMAPASWTPVVSNAEVRDALVTAERNADALVAELLAGKNAGTAGARQLLVLHGTPGSGRRAYAKSMPVLMGQAYDSSVQVFAGEIARRLLQPLFKRLAVSRSSAKTKGVVESPEKEAFLLEALQLDERFGALASEVAWGRERSSLREAMRLGLPAIAESDGDSMADIKEQVAAAKERGYRVVGVFLKTPISIIKRRAEERFDKELELGTPLGGRLFGALVDRANRLAIDTWPDLASLCDEVKEVQQRDEQVMRRRSTLGGLSPDQRKTLTSELTRSKDDYDSVKLEQLLGQAAAHGFESDEVSSARQVFESLQTEEYLIAMILENREAIAEPMPPAQLLTRMQNLSAQIRKMQGNEEVASHALQATQDAQRRRSRGRSALGSDWTSLQDKQLADSVFKDLSTFSRLKDERNWKGHAGLLRGLVGGKGPMLTHSKAMISEALTKVPDRLESEAKQSFTNILTWMGDRPAQEVVRVDSREEVLRAAQSSPELRDEVFVQLMKQLSSNLGARSCLEGWKLMLDLCGTVIPSEELTEFLRCFLALAAREGAAPEERYFTNDQGATLEAWHFAKDSLTALSALQAQSGTAEGGRGKTAARVSLKSDPSDLADDSAAVLGVVVYLIDGITQKVYSQLSVSLGVLGQQVGSRLGVVHTGDFSFYQVLEGCETPRMLADDIKLSDLSEHWQELKEATGRRSRLSWRRRFVGPNEILKHGDPAHAALTFRQALACYQGCCAMPQGEQQLACRVAGALLCAEVSGTDAEAQSRMKDPAFMEKLLPAYLVDEVPSNQREALYSEIFSMAKQMRPELGSQVHHFQRMSKTLGLLQELTLFGSHCWPVRQSNGIPGGQAVVVDPPKHTMRFDDTGKVDKETRGLFLFVNLKGVYLYSRDRLDKETDSSVQRAFFFLPQKPTTSEMGRGSRSMIKSTQGERLLKWGAVPPGKKRDAESVPVSGYLQLVVLASPQGSSKSYGDDDVRPHLVTLECADALDVAYVIHRAVTEVAVLKPDATLARGSHTMALAAFRSSRCDTDVDYG